MITNLRNRLQRLESNGRMGEIELTLENNARVSIRRRRLLDVVHDALFASDKGLEGSAMLRTVRMSDQSHIHQLVQALHAGPKESPRNTPPEEA